MTRAAMRVRLRDVTLADADMLDAWAADPRALSEFNDFGQPPQPTPREALRNGPLRNDRNGMLVVELADGTPVGTVGWHRVNYGPSPQSDAWNIGIELLPSARGKGYGTEAQRLLAGYLFETTALHRVEASTDVANLAEQRSLEKAGYRREGIQRGAQFRAGVYHDLVTYALLREDP
jgi:RimJ/RimL family protein N-acetyltransferase